MVVGMPGTGQVTAPAQHITVMMGISNSIKNSPFLIHLITTYQMRFKNYSYILHVKKKFPCFISNFTKLMLLCRPPVGWRSTYCFTDVGVGVTPITKGTPAQIFFGRIVFCSLVHWLWIFAMILTFALKVKL